MGGLGIRFWDEIERYRGQRLVCIVCNYHKRYFIKPVGENFTIVGLVDGSCSDKVENEEDCEFAVVKGKAVVSMIRVMAGGLERC